MHHFQKRKLSRAIFMTLTTCISNTDDLEVRQFFFQNVSSEIDSSEDSEILNGIILSTKGSIIKYMMLHVHRIKAVEVLTLRE